MHLKHAGLAVRPRSLRLGFLFFFRLDCCFVSSFEVLRRQSKTTSTNVPIVMGKFFVYFLFITLSFPPLYYNTTITHTFCFKSNFSLFFYNFFPHRTNMPFLPKKNSIYKTTTNSISLIQTLPTNNHKN